MVEQSSKTVKIFYCYAHEDKELRDELGKHLMPLQRLGRINDWCDQQIQAGIEWEEEIKHRLDEADVILLLVSSDFIASDYCYSNEMQHAFEMHQAGQAHVIPILLRSVYWERTPIARLQMLPTGARPIALWSDRDQALENVAKGISEVVDTLVSQTSQPKSINIYIGYVLGFTAAKLAWYHGTSIQFFGLKAQFKGFANKLLLDKTMTEEILQSFNPTKDLGEVLENAQRGIEARDTLSLALISQYGEIISATFRFGFNLIFLMPQLEVLQVAQESKSESTPPGDLLGPLESQFNNLIADAQIIGLVKEKQQFLRESYARAFDGHAEEVRTRLIELGANLERDFKI